MASQLSVPERPSGPVPSAKTTTSPSLNEELRKCFMRVAFATDGRFGEGAPSVAAALGTAAHRLLEEASKGAFDADTPEGLLRAVRTRWDGLIGEQVTELEGRALGLVPNPGRWRNYAMKKAAATRAALRIARRSTELPASRGQGGQGLKPEAWYMAFDGRLGGRIDLVYHGAEGTELLDYKSGTVIEADDAGLGRLREAYVRQLQIYAVLFHETTGKWPVRTSVESLVDGYHAFPVDPEECERVVTEALALLDRYNQQVAGGDLSATPSSENCAWCSYRPVCPAYLDNAGEDWSPFRAVIAGRLSDLADGEPGRAVLSVDSGDRPAGPTTIRGIPSDLARALNDHVGDRVSFADLEPIYGTADFRFSWFSQYWWWSA